MLQKTPFKLMFAFAFIVGFFMFAHSASAATYYVSTTGSNANPGTALQPWLTLTHAEASAATNDTVNVAPGTYTETNFWNASKGITWIATGAGATVRSTGASYVLRANGTTTASWNNFTFDAQGAKPSAVFINAASNKSFTNSTFTGGTSIAFNLNGTNVSVTNSTFTVTAGSALRFSAFNNVSVTGSTFTVTGTRVFDTTSTGGTLTFNSNTITSTIGSLTNAAFELSSNGTYTIMGNTMANSGRILNAVTGTGSVNFSANNVTLTLGGPSAVNYIAFPSGTWGVTIDGNRITSATTTGTGNIINIVNQNSPLVKNNYISTSSTGALAGVAITSTGTAGGAIEIKTNIFESRSLSGYVISIGTESSTAGNNKLDGALIEGNRIYGSIYFDPTTVSSSGVHSIFVGYNKDATIRYNMVNGGGYGVVIKHGGTAYTTGGIYYNEFINSVGSYPVRIKGVKDVAVSNNTIYTDSSFTNNYYSIYITQNTNSSEPSSGTVLKNNIVIGGGGLALIGIDNASVTGFVSDYNVLYNQTGGVVGANTSIPATYTFAQWQTLGYDASSSSTNPNLLNLGAYDLRLTGTSNNSVNTGANLGFSTDIEGNSVPVGGTPDIGAHEFLLPMSPTSLGQFESDTVTVIPVAGTAGSTTVVFKFTAASNNDSDVLTPEVEVRPLAVGFLNTTTHTGSNVSFTGTPTTGVVTVTGLAPAAGYRWQARLKNLAGESSWVAFAVPAFYTP